MKKTIAQFMSLLLCAALLAACGKAPMIAEAPEEPSAAPTAPAEEPSAAAEESGETAPDGARYAGQWTDELTQRAWLRIVPTGESGTYDVLLHWGDTAATFVEWDMTAVVDADGSLRYTDGRRSFVTLHEDAPEERALEREGAAGRFFFEGDALRWEDDGEDSDEDVRFLPVTTYAPAASELLDRFFKPVALIPVGTSGSSLRRAQTACDALRYADANALWCCDEEELRAALTEAWAGLTAEEQAAFAENLLSVRALIADSAADWAGSGAVFTDAGVGEEMQALEADRAALASWERLCESALALLPAQGQEG